MQHAVITRRIAGYSGTYAQCILPAFCKKGPYFKSVISKPEHLKIYRVILCIAAQCVLSFKIQEIIRHCIDQIKV